jgi:hypothetical protein
MELTVMLHKHVVERRAEYWDQHARIYGLGAQVDIPLILVMSRLDTILNPQDNDTPALRFGHLCYAEILTNVLLLYRLPSFEKGRRAHARALTSIKPLFTYLEHR